jgi:site-specific recombinase XerD
MTNPCASRSVAVQDAHVKVTNCGCYVASSAQPPSLYVFCSDRGGPIAAKSFHTLISRLGERAGMAFPTTPACCATAAAMRWRNAGHDTRAIQAWMGHKNIQHTVRCTELAPDRFKDFWWE